MGFSVRLVYGLLKHLNCIDSCGHFGRDMVCGFLALFWQFRHFHWILSKLNFLVVSRSSEACKLYWFMWAFWQGWFVVFWFWRSGFASQPFCLKLLPPPSMLIRLYFKAFAASNTVFIINCKLFECSYFQNHTTSWRKPKKSHTCRFIG